VTQQVYVLTQLGRNEEAAKLFESVDIQDIPDLSTRHIGRVNALTISGDLTNPFLAHRLFHSTTQLPKNDLPFEYQSSILRQNQSIMDLLCLKYPGVAHSTAEVLALQPSPTTSATANSNSVLNAAAHARGQADKAALKAILPLLEKRPNDVGLLLTVIQLYLLTNNHGSAITLIEKFFARLENSKKSTDSDVRFAPGLVSVLVSLYAKESRKAHVKTELAKAASYWRLKRKMERGSVIPVSLLRAAGTILLESASTEDAKAAGELFAVLHDEDPNDRASTAGLIASHATSDHSKVPSEALQSLSPAVRLVADIDAAALEDAGVARPPMKLSGSNKDTAKKRPAEDAKAKKKRIRPSRMPKDFAEGKKVDPERWQPLRDRSYWRPKGKKGKARAAGLTQGGVIEEEKGRQVAESTKPSGGGGVKKKKKGKGGKW
jgi:signal recognition particle subunit SRP72